MAFLGEIMARNCTSLENHAGNSMWVISDFCQIITEAYWKNAKTRENDSYQVCRQLPPGWSMSGGWCPRRNSCVSCASLSTRCSPSHASSDGRSRRLPAGEGCVCDLVCRDALCTWAGYPLQTIIDIFIMHNTRLILEPHNVSQYKINQFQISEKKTATKVPKFPQDILPDTKSTHISGRTWHKISKLKCTNLKNA